MPETVLIGLWFVVNIGILLFFGKIIKLRGDFAGAILFSTGMIFLLTVNILKLTEYLPSIPAWFFFIPAVVFTVTGGVFRATANSKRK